MKPVRVGLLGLGTVGGGTLNVIVRNATEIARRAGREIVVTHAAAREFRAETIEGLDRVVLSEDAFTVVDNPDIDVVVELIGGYSPARELVLRAIENGKHVVTANKALIAMHGNEIFAAAQAKGVTVAFEAAVAGGIPIMRGDDGAWRMALIKVTRRSGVTWEVAKGKLEPGETPESAGIREVREEMGIDSELVVTGYVGLIRYGFLAPGGLPRLKSVYLYLMQTADGSVPEFTPREAEGIGEVQWFTPDDACKAVTHSSLKPIMKVARDMVEVGESPEE